ncbi:hypothetical protein [Methylomagnum sp.]
MKPKTLAILAVRRNPSGDVGLLMGYGAPLPFQNSVVLHGAPPPILSAIVFNYDAVWPHMTGLTKH